MPEVTTRQIVDYAHGDQGTEFRDALYANLHDKVMAHIEAKKQEIAQNLFAGQQEQEETPEVEVQTEITPEEIPVENT